MTRQYRLGGFQATSQTTPSNAAWRLPGLTVNYSDAAYHRPAPTLERKKFNSHTDPRNRIGASASAEDLYCHNSCDRLGEFSPASNAPTPATRHLNRRVANERSEERIIIITV